MGGYYVVQRKVQKNFKSLWKPSNRFSSHAITMKAQNYQTKDDKRKHKLILSE